MTMYQHEHREVKYPVWTKGSDENTEKTMRLDYYIYESDVDWEFRLIGSENAARFNVISYGIGVTETGIGDGVFEEKIANDVTHDAEKALSILRLLADNCVTPCCLTDALEEICAADATVALSTAGVMGAGMMNANITGAGMMNADITGAGMMNADITDAGMMNAAESALLV